MNDLLTPLKDIRASVDPSALLSGGGGKGTSLSDQIKFSSLMKTLVDTPQETLAAVQNNAQPVEQPTGATKYPEQRLDHGTNHQRTPDDGGKRYKVEQFDKPGQDTAPLTSMGDSSDQDNRRTNGLGDQTNMGERQPALNKHEITKNNGFGQFSDHASFADSGEKNFNQDGVYRHSVYRIFLKMEPLSKNPVRVTSNKLSLFRIDLLLTAQKYYSIISKIKSSK